MTFFIKSCLLYLIVFTIFPNTLNVFLLFNEKIRMQQFYELNISVTNKPKYKAYLEDISLGFPREIRQELNARAADMLY